MGGAAFAVCVCVAWLDPTTFEQYVWFYFVGGRGNGPLST
ncbi:hypothetical protein P3T39_007586 [Kitasatospora sp. GP82]|nr:hypothetical protein [Kitasatospora sp. GP82]